MSRRTFLRAAAAGLIAAALGTPSSATAQAPNPRRGETAARPTAPAPRAVTPAPTRQLVIGFGLSSTNGITGTIQVRDLPARTQGAPAPREVAATPTAYAAVGACPVETVSTTQVSPAVALKPIAAGTAPAAAVATGWMTHPDGRVVPASHVARVLCEGPALFMPPPAPLPGQVQAPVGNVLIPVEVQFVAPPKGVPPVWTPTTNAVPPIPSAQQ